MKSMTGYGRATARTERYEITAEVHSVNHRYLETSVRLPRSFSYLEGKIKEQVQQAVSRGKVEVALTMQSIGSKDTTVEINHDVVMAYLRAVAAENELLRESGLPKIRSCWELREASPAVRQMHCRFPHCSAFRMRSRCSRLQKTPM